jgi:hypothetical protein
MAKGKKTGGKNFAEGNPGGPGRPKIPEEERQALAVLKRMRKDNRHLWNAYYEELISLTNSELTAIIGTKDRPANPHTPVLKLVIARSLRHAMSTGRAFELQVHREMMCGPEPKQVELSGPEGEPLSPLGKYTQEQLASVFAAADKIVKEADACSSTPNPSPPSSGHSPGLLPPSPRPSSGTAS